jgi:hypothetical protein
VHRLDPATLFLTNAVVFGTVALVTTFYYATQRTYPGFREWLAGAWSATVALVALALLGGGGPASRVAILLANVLIVRAGEWLYRGTAGFAGAASRLGAADLAVYGGGLAAFSWWLFVDYDVSRRIAVFSLCLAWACGKTVLAALRLARGPYRASGLFLALATSLLCVLPLVRGVAALVRAREHPQLLMQRTGVELVLLAGCMGAAVVAILAFMILNGRRTTVELEEALGQVKQLEGIIPICMYCKKVQVDPDSWTRIEKYVAEHSQATFSHGICPDCFAREQGHPNGR